MSDHSPIWNLITFIVTHITNCKHTPCMLSYITLSDLSQTRNHTPYLNPCCLWTNIIDNCLGQINLPYDSLNFHMLVGQNMLDSVHNVVIFYDGLPLLGSSQMFTHQFCNSLHQNQTCFFNITFSPIYRCKL